MKRILTQLLNLTELVVESSLQEDLILFLTVSKKAKSAVCPQCGKKSEHLHQNQKYLVKDLPMGDFEVILNVNRRRFKCKTCRKTFNEELDFVGARKGYTHRYAENIVKQLINSNISNVAKNNRFHVTKIIHEELNQARIAEKKTASSLNVELREKVFDSLKGNKYTILKAEENLTEKQKEKLDIIREASPLIGMMHSLKEEFRNLFDRNEDLGAGMLGLIDWLKKAEPYYQKSVKTIKRWFGEVVGYFERKTTKGVVEGINNKLKLIKRSGFGFRNFRNFEIRALLSWHYDINLAR